MPFIPKIRRNPEFADYCERCEPVLPPRNTCELRYPTLQLFSEWQQFDAA
jgi:hypothetical protein